jgi:PQQ-dependent dehydrogenase (methanol/ethanol family)
VPTRIKALLVVLGILGAAIALSACGSSTNDRITTGEYVVKPPDIEDWPLAGRDRDNTRFATQGAIDTGNVDGLGEAWSIDLGPGKHPMESNPIVIGNEVFVTTSTDEILAIDGATGHDDWTYTPGGASTGSGNHGVAAEDGRLFLLTSGGELQAVSQKTGKLLWSATVAGPSTGAQGPMAPTVYEGRVYVGGSAGGRGFVAAYDQRTGKQSWRYFTVPRPGTGWVPKGGGGGTVYISPTVDPGTGVLYVATGNPRPATVGVKTRGNDLFTASLLALDAGNGELLWYHQEGAHDIFDYDPASPALLFRAEIEERRRRGIAETSKSGMLFFLDARTGKSLFDSVPIVKRDHRRPSREGTLECPGAIDDSWYAPSAYSPETQSVYVSGVSICTLLKVEAAANGKKTFRVLPQGTTEAGTLLGVSTITGETIWKRTTPTPMAGGAAATDGNLVFAGDQSGILYAFDAENGQVKWQGDLNLAVGTAPVVYTIGGTEYVLCTIGGAALTAAEKTPGVGAKVVALKLGGKELPTGPGLKSR